MALTSIQRDFIVLFIEDFDFKVTCNTLGIRQQEALRWLNDIEFQRARDAAHMAKLRILGYGPLLVIEDTLAIAHSDITKIIGMDDGEITMQKLSELPRRHRVAIKSIECGVAFNPETGKPTVYPKKITMHDKSPKLVEAAEWFEAAEHEAVKARVAVSDGPKRISGLMIELIDPAAEEAIRLETEKLLED